MVNSPAKKAAPNLALAARREATLVAFKELVNLVPLAEEGDIADLLGPILAAQDWEELNVAGKLPSSKTLVDHTVEIQDMRRKVSDQDSLTGYYLLCDAVDLKTAEFIRFSAGGAQAVAVLSKLYVMNLLPARVKFSAVKIADVGEAINAEVLTTTSQH